jgi:hypothetical protein
MTLLPLPAPLLLSNGLVNRGPVQCPVCGRYVATFAGVPLIFNERVRVIDFAHPDCCPDAR